MHVTDEITRRDTFSSITPIDFYEVLCRLADYWASGGYGEELAGTTAANLEEFLKLMVEGLAVAWTGELRCQCHGHSYDQKLFAKLHKFLPTEDDAAGNVQHLKEVHESTERHLLLRKGSVQGGGGGTESEGGGEGGGV
jgi:hypothetical protein